MKYGYHLYGWREYSTAVFTLTSTLASNGAFGASASLVGLSESDMVASSATNGTAICIYGSELDVNAVSSLGGGAVITLNISSSTGGLSEAQALGSVTYTSDMTVDSQSSIAIDMRLLYEYQPKENETYSLNPKENETYSLIPKENELYTEL